MTVSFGTVRRRHVFRNSPKMQVRKLPSDLWLRLWLRKSANRCRKRSSPRVLTLHSSHKNQRHLAAVVSTAKTAHASARRSFGAQAWSSSTARHADAPLDVTTNARDTFSAKAAPSVTPRSAGTNCRPCTVRRREGNETHTIITVQNTIFT